MGALPSHTPEVDREQKNHAPFSGFDTEKLERVRWPIVGALVRDLTVGYFYGRFGAKKDGSTVKRSRKRTFRIWSFVFLSLFYLVMLVLISGLLTSAFQDMVKIDVSSLGSADEQLKDTLGLSFYMGLTLIVAFWFVFVLSLNQPNAFLLYFLYPVKRIELVWARLIFSLQMWSMVAIGVILFSAIFKGDASWDAFWTTTVPFFVTLAGIVTFISSITIYYDLAVKRKRIVLFLFLGIFFYTASFMLVDRWIENVYLKEEHYKLGWGFLWGLYQIVLGWTHPWMVALAWIFLGVMGALFWSWRAYRTMLRNDYM